MPPLPSWDGIHPLIIHFPIALLLVAPLLIVVGMALRERGRSWMTAALVVMGLGTVAAWVAVASGEAAGQLADRGGPVDEVLARHEEMAEAVRGIFTGLTVVFAGIVLLPRVMRRELPRVVWTAAVGFFLVAYAVGSLFLAKAAHQGGRLVHEFGVHAVMPGGDQPASPGVVRGGTDED